MASLYDKGRIEIKLGEYGVAPATAITDLSILPRVQDYRRQTAGRLVPLDRDEMGQRIPTADYHVSLKIDGEFSVLVYRDGEVFTVNPGGTVRVGMPWMSEAARLLGAAGLNEAICVGELYVAAENGRRERVHDVTKIARQPKSEDELKRLRFAVFDLISWNGAPVGGAFDEVWKTITKTFDGGQLVHPVQSVWVKDPKGVEKQFFKWVEGQGAEGLVVRSDTAGMFKIKPRHTLDAAVIGFTESTEQRQGMMHDLLLAVMRGDGAIQVLCRVGGGFSDDLRREMLSDLKDMLAESEYAEVNSDHVAYQMVRPEWVVEISCLDLISQTTRGGPINRMVLNWSRNGGAGRYEVIRRLPLVSVISPQFIRRRDDKRVEPTDVRVRQVADLVEVPLVERDASRMMLPQSGVLRREVYTKQLKGETMVRKFLMWKTNKETETDDYPAYVLHYTDFSPNRKMPLSRDVRVSSSREQIDQLWDGMKESNIKKGWNVWGDATRSDEAASAAEASEPAKATKDKAANKKKKSTAKKKKKKKKSS